MTETVIELDRVHRAIRSGSRWAVQRRLPEGGWDLIEAWNGGRRSLVIWCEAHDVYPTREAEAILATLPEATGFRERV